MKYSRIASWLVLCAMGIVGAPFLRAEESHVNIVQTNDRVRVEIGGKLFTEYYFTNVPRPFCYPILGPDQLEMTRDYPMRNRAGEEHDHVHHRSLWYGHGSVNGYDFWGETATNPIVHVKFLEVSSGDKSGVIKTENKWMTKEGKWVLSDERTLTFYNQTNPKMMDFEITLKASNGDVVFGDTKEGSMAVRVAESMRLSFGKRKGEGNIILSTGITGAKTWGKRADWCDYVGPIDHKTVGIAVFDHPQNPRHPTWWHVRDYGLLAANPFGQHFFENKPAGAGNFKIPSGQSVTFRYRFVFHEGDDKKAGIAGLYEEYAKKKF